MKTRVVYGESISSVKTQKFFIDLHERTEMAVSSGRFTRQQNNYQSLREKEAAFKNTIKQVLGDEWLYIAPVGRKRH